MSLSHEEPSRVERAQSTTLGFVFVFSLITLTIGSVYAVGFAGLQDAQTAERIENMERGFEVLDDNIEDLTRNGAPSRATELKLTGGRIGVSSQTTIRINVINTTGSFNETVNGTQAIVYTAEETRIATTSGAILRGESNGAVMLRDPDWIVSSERVVIPVIIFNQIGNGSIGGEGTVLVVANAIGRTVAINERAPGTDLNVTVTVESPRAAAWDRYMSDLGMTRVGGPPSDSDGDGVPEVTYSIETRQVQVTRVAVGVEITQ